MSRHLILLAVGASILGCNAIDAKPKAESVAEKVFSSRQSGDRDATLALYHEAFYEATPRNEWITMLEAIEAKLGAPERHELNSWKVFVGSGQAGAGTYTTLAYDVQYPSASGTETLVFFSSAGGGEPRIVGHNVNSPALLAR